MFGLCRIFGGCRHHQEESCCKWPKVISPKDDHASLADEEKLLEDKLDAVRKEKAALKDQ